MNDIVKNIDESNYYKYIALSASQLKDYAKSPYEFWKYSVFNPDSFSKESKSMNFGSMAHCLLLEPEKFDEQYVVNYDGYDMRTKAGKEWRENQTKIVVSTSEYNQATKMVQSIKNNDFTQALMENITAEKPFLADIGDGFWLKGKTDAIKRLANGEIIIIDYKTTNDDLEKWRKFNTYSFHDVQTAVYQQLCFLEYGQYASHFYFLVQSNKEGFEDKFAVYEYDQMSIDRAISYVFGKNRDTNFIIENDEIVTNDNCGIIYKCKRDLYNYFKKNDIHIFDYFKEPIMMDNSSREYDMYVENFGKTIND